MVYAGKARGRRLTLGVSGRLLDSNLVMWDPETNSLWSQMSGRALHGPLKGAELGMLPAVFVPLETWVHMHPDTLVLDLGTVRTRRWYYTGRNLSTARNERHEPLGIAVRQRGEALVVGLEHLHRLKVFQATVGGTPLAFVWVKKHRAPLVYVAGSGRKPLDLGWRSGRLVDKQGRGQWDALTGRPAAGSQVPALKRFPYIPTLIRAWRGMYPGGRVVGRQRR